jgi:hypothetical protein
MGAEDTIDAAGACGAGRGDVRDGRAGVVEVEDGGEVNHALLA